MIRTFRRWAIAVACMIMALAMAMSASAPRALADTLRLPDGGHLEFFYNGVSTLLGMTAVDEHGRVYYCIEADQISGMDWGPVSAMDDSEEARRIAWLIERYRDDRDALTQGAIGLLVHDHFDLRKDTTWPDYRAIAVQTYPELEPTAQRLWDEAAAHTPVDAVVERTYTQGLREGEVTVKVTNGGGAAVAGVPYTVVLEGPAEFADGASSASGVTGTAPTAHAWRATGRGPVNASVRYEAGTLDHMESSQDLVRFGGMEQRSGPVVTFEIRKDFTPSLATATGATMVEAGEPLVDHVTSGLADERSRWVPGLELAADGWYFDGLDTATSPMMPDDGQSAADFLNRLAKAGHAPSAYGSATFTGPDQTVSVTAVTEPDGSTPYRAKGDGLLGTWVWAFTRDRQSEQAREYLLADTVSPFMETPETNVNRAGLTVESSVTEHSAVVGAELSDTITVSGFPDDHGEFAGNEALGLGADRPYAQVSVWWSGDMADPANDEQYRPQGEAVPQEDEHHRMVGQWDYPARNGRIRVGAGAQDAHGEPVHIGAERHGWYVFVWRFDGDDRVAPAASAYDDAWERTRIEQFAPPDTPSLTTHVDEDRVQVGEPFHDVAHVSGSVPAGAYVQFDAYGAVEAGAAPDSGGKLVDGARSDADPAKRDQLVTSPEARSHEAGLVYWRATLFSPEGDVLATHELGVPGETVAVEEPPAEERLAEERLAHSGVGITPLGGIGAALGAVGLGALASAVLPRLHAGGSGASARRRSKAHQR